MSNPVDPQAMRSSMRLWPSGVSVVTSAFEDVRSGLTVSAFNSLSLEPPMILVCLHKDSNTIPVIERSGVFAVSFLNAEQQLISDRFAGRTPLAEGESRLSGIDVHTAVTGAPIISGAIAWVDCNVAMRHDGSTHWIYIGEVQATGQSDGKAGPLLYFDRSYHALQTVAAAP